MFKAMTSNKGSTMQEAQMIDLLESPLFPISDFQETQTPVNYIGGDHKMFSKANLFAHNGSQTLKKAQTHRFNQIF